MNRGFRGKKRSGRPTRKLPPKPLILIVCEGKKTEPLYFNALRKSRKINKEQIRIITGSQCKNHNPLGLITCARKFATDFRRKDEIFYDEIWCIFDCDDPNIFQQALDQAPSKRIKVAYSNPCFEFWFLLHFTSHTSHLTCSQAEAALKTHFPEYEKGMEDMYESISDFQHQAISRSKDLRRLHENNFNKPSSNPSTSVDFLVELLNRLEH